MSDNPVEDPGLSRLTSAGADARMIHFPQSVTAVSSIADPDVHLPPIIAHRRFNGAAADSAQLLRVKKTVSSMFWKRTSVLSRSLVKFSRTSLKFCGRLTQLGGCASLFAGGICMFTRTAALRNGCN